MIRRLKLFSLSAFAIFGIVLVGGESVAALTTTLPNYSGPPIAPLENAASAGVNRPQHYIIASHESNDGYQVDIAAYMSNYNPNRRIELYRTSPAYNLYSGNQCKISNAPGINDSTNVLQVSMSGAGLTTVNYDIRKDQACVAPYTNTRANAANSRFWGTYQLPAGTPVLDAATGLYKVNISIRFTSAITLSDQDFSSAMTFRARLLAAPAADVLPGGAFVGTIASGGGANPRGVGSITLTPDTDREYYRHYFDFGSPCSQTVNVERVVTIRDPDNYANSPPGALSSTQGGGVTGRSGPRPLRVQVLENGLPLAASRYISVVQGSVAGYPNAGSPAWVRPTSIQDLGGQSLDTTIRFAMIPGGRYQLVVLDAYYRNIIQVQLPTDASYNAITCPAPDFELEPSLNDLVDSIIPGETSVGPIEARVDNTGADPTPTTTHAGIARYVYRGSGSLATSGDTVGGITTAANYSCRIVEAENLETPAPQECDVLWEDEVADGISGDTLLESIANFNPSTISPALEVGHQVCFVAVVNRYNETVGETDWRYSDPVCIKVAKVPFVHIEGHDIRVGSALDATNNQPSIVAGFGVLSGGNLYGSRSEYAIFAPGNSTGFSSGFSTSATTADRNRLTFSNDSTFGNFVAPGGLAALGTIPNVANYFFEGGVPTTANIRPEIDAIVDYTALPSSQINATTVTTSRVFYNNNDIDIRGNITVNQLANPGQIRQAVIIANGDINIRSNVTRIDAWLVSIGGTINTCTPPGASAPLSTSGPFCTQALEVNGPVMADRLLLRRTAGANNTAQLNNPAERINLPASTFLWGHQMEQTNGSLQTTYTRELPPRF